MYGGGFTQFPPLKIRACLIRDNHVFNKFCCSPNSESRFKLEVSSRSSYIYKSQFLSGISSKYSVNGLFLKNAAKTRKLAASDSARRLNPVMEWQDCSAEIEVDVPCSVAYNCYSDRESIPLWMPFISSVKVLKDKPDLSRWYLKYEVFGQNVEFSWLARNLQPIRNQKIHWRSLEGLPNRGAVRFYPKGPSSCKVQLTISYEVPQILSPVAAALKPFTEGLLLQGLKQFAEVAKNYPSTIP